MHYLVYCSFPVSNYDFLQAPSTDIAVSELQHASTEVSEIVFFLLGAMTIVEIVDSHQGFKLVTDNITTRKPRTLLWVVSSCFYSHVDVFLLDIGEPDFFIFILGRYSIRLIFECSINFLERTMFRSHLPVVLEICWLLHSNDIISFKNTANPQIAHTIFSCIIRFLVYDFLYQRITYNK